MEIISTVLLCVATALISLIIWKIRTYRNYFKNRGIACDPPSLLLGNMQGVRKTRTFSEIWCDYYFKFKGSGPFAGFFLFQSASAFILDMDLVKNILIKDFSKFTDRGFYHNEADDPLSGQIFLLDGQKWRRMRQKLSPTFTSGKIKYMFPTVIKVGEVFAKVFADLVKQDAVVEVKEILARYTTDVIGTCAFGIECNSLKDPKAEFRIMGEKSVTDERHNTVGIAILHAFPKIARFLHLKQTPEHIEEFFMRIVRENVEYREKNSIKRNDFMDMLIDLKNNKMMKTEDGQHLANLSIEEIAAQAFVFFSAGFETSSSTMGFALFELAQNPDIQKKAREEVLQVLAQHNQEFTYESIKEMRYLDQVISETLRLYTILPVLNRQALVDYPVPGHPQYVIPKGMSVIIPCEAIHLDPEFYPKPTVFDPERFSPEMVKERDSVYWLPFGDGPRNCIGMRFGQMQTRIGLALLLKNFKFSTCEKTQIPPTYNVESFLKRTRDGIHLRVETIG